jgi:hypothetical protein
MEQDEQVVNGYYKTAEGTWSQTENSKNESLATYYSNRVAYDPQDRRRIIGHYSPTGEVITFSKFPAKSAE